MISPQIKSSKEAGVTLLLSILVLSALVAISFSFASIILIEIRSSGDVVRTEPDYYAVQGVVEQTIFKIKRSIPPNDQDPSDPYNFDFGACKSDAPVDKVGATVATTNPVSLFSGICNVNPDADVKDVVPPTQAGDPAFTQNIYNVYDPANPYTNTACVHGNPPDCDGGTEYPSAYSNIEFHYLPSPGAASTIYFCSATKDCLAPPEDGGQAWDAVVTLDSSTPCVQFFDSRYAGSNHGCTMGGAILVDKAYQFFVVNVPTSTPRNAGIQIKSWGPDPVNHQDNPTYIDPDGKGLPVFGQFAVSVTASSHGLTRKYQVNIPSE